MKEKNRPMQPINDPFKHYVFSLKKYIEDCHNNNIDEIEIERRVEEWAKYYDGQEVIGEYVYDDKNIPLVAFEEWLEETEQDLFLEEIEIDE